MASTREKREPGIKPTDLNFMVVKGTGRVRRFKISSRLLTFAFIFFLAYVVVSLFGINRYLTLRLQTKDQAQQILRMKSELTTLKHKLYEARQRLALLEHPVATKTSTNQPTKKVPPQIAKAKVAPLIKEAKTGEKPAPPPPKPQQEPAKAKPLVEIKDLTVKATPASLDVAFKVVNASDGPGPVRGYVHMIWLPDPSDLSSAWSYPRVTLVDGIPSQYRTGRLFSIKRFREIRASFERKPEKEVPRVLRIIAYDRSGDKVFLKDYEVNQLLKPKPVTKRPKPTTPQQPSPPPKVLPQDKPQSTKALLSG